MENGNQYTLSCLVSTYVSMEGGKEEREGGRERGKGNRGREDESAWGRERGREGKRTLLSWIQHANVCPIKSLN